MHAMLFAENPMQGNPLQTTTDAIRALNGEEWLSTILLDHLLQTTLEGNVPNHVLIGSSDCYTYFRTYNDKLDKDDNADTAQTMCGGLQAYTKNNPPQLQIIPNENPFQPFSWKEETIIASRESICLSSICKQSTKVLSFSHLD
ncbi:hypothetical protein IV203_029935 [Nitzschia inconspicua]|uniref:Uncharacterized protein n=1 Tax=Nitzschia inconspicua TaxID=303405 RepID=A0A9K3LRN6_9STRA|nr:hypothetical protein IV203_029935 [Nitzschia inconspicua]